MKKNTKSKLLCLLLITLMLVTAISGTSCGKKNEPDTEEDSRRAVTLSIWGIRGEGTTDEAIEAVEKAMSAITTKQFNTAIDLVLLPADEYQQAVEAKLTGIEQRIADEEAAAKAAKAAAKKAKKEAEARGETLPETAPVTETVEGDDETYIDDINLVQTVYPPVDEKQLDIFLITDYDMLLRLQKADLLSALDEELAGASKLIKSYIHPAYVSAGVIDLRTFAIGTNQPVGDYTYALFNRELIDKYLYDPTLLGTFQDVATGKTNFENTYSFLIDVLNDPDFTGSVIAGDLSFPEVHYFSEDGSRSVMGSILSASADQSQFFRPISLIGNKRFTNYLTYYKKMQEQGMIGPEEITPEDDFGVAIYHGYPEDLENVICDEDHPDGKYYARVLRYPTLTTEKAYDGMFAVSAYTKSVSRSMEILTYLNTKSDLLNIFAYGIEGVHYELDENGVVHKLSKNYNMDLKYVGNCYLAYPPEGTTPDYWEQVKRHNLDAVTDPYLAFTYEVNETNQASYDALRAFSDNFFKTYETKTSAELEEWFSEQKDLIGEEKAIQWLIDLNEGKSLLSSYTDWHDALYPPAG